MTEPEKIPAIYTSDSGQPEDLCRERPSSAKMRRLAEGDDVTVVLCPKRHPLVVADRSPFPAGLWRAWLGPYGHRVRLESPSLPLEASCRCGRRWTLDPAKLQEAARSAASTVSISHVT